MLNTLVKKWENVSITTSVVEAKVFVVEPIIGLRPLIVSLDAIGIHANDLINVYAPRQWGKTSVQTAAAASATAIDLVSSGTADQISGHTVVAGDWSLIQLDAADTLLGSWQMGRIASLGGGTAADIEIATWDATGGAANEFNNVTNGALRAAASVGNTAYIIDSTMLQTLTLGAATVHYDYPVVGFPGHPLVVTLVGGDTNASLLSATVGYVE